MIEEIEAWRSANVDQSKNPVRPSNPRDPYRARAKWQAENERLKYLQAAGKLIDVEIPSRHFGAILTEMTALLRQVPDRQDSRLPDAITAEERKLLREQLADDIDAALLILADSLEEEAANWDEGDSAREIDQDE